MASIAYAVVFLSCVFGAGAVGAGPDDIVTSLKAVYDFPVMTIKDVVSKSFSRAAASEGLPPHDLSCVRDYGARCPSGWAFDGAESCQAPESYKGNCAPSMKFEGTPAEKSSSAMECGATYSCMDACQEDFEGAECPLGWGLDLDSSCVAPSGYTGPCVRRKRFAGWSAAAKENWAAVCQLTYPCKAPLAMGPSATACTPTSTCPSSWLEVSPGSCRAPANYQGPCSLSLDVRGVSGQEKLLIAERCAVSFCSI